MATREQILRDGIKEAIHDFAFIKAMVLDDLIRQYMDAAIAVQEQYLKDAS